MKLLKRKRVHYLLARSRPRRQKERAIRRRQRHGLARALKKLQKLRRRVRRFKKLGKSLDKLKSPNLGRALEFLDDKLLGATSNAVERANRPFRKA